MKKRWDVRFHGMAVLLGCLSMAATGVHGQGEDTLPPPVELKKMSLEELMDIEVSLVSKQPEKLTEAASAIQVITNDEIRRSGASTLPEALRLASNLQVAQVDSRTWAISARGLNSVLANKLLVMIDGRTVYTPLHAGVFWDIQNLVLDNVDRIEIISGPGGTLWGANAVNGVINIVTKGAETTQGAMVGAGGGTFLRDMGVARYGNRIGEHLFYRVSGQRFDENSTDSALSGREGHVNWNMTQGALRTDWIPAEAERLTVLGNIYGGSIEQPNQDSTGINGQNVLARWSLGSSPESDLALQIYFDRNYRNIPRTGSEDLQTYDLDFHHRFPIGKRQSVLWGLGYRLSQDHVQDDTRFFTFMPADKTLQLFNGFAQDQIDLIENRLKLTLGTKIEHNDYSGFELLPSSRLAWTPDPYGTVWAAVSRAVRSPSRIDVDFFAPNPAFLAPSTRRLSGGPEFGSEELTAYELGYRVAPVPVLSLSAAAFFNHYDDLRVIEQLDSVDFEYRNGLKGDVWGLELSSNLQATDWWRLRGGYTWLDSRFNAEAGHTPFPQAGYPGDDPGFQVSLLSMMDLPHHFQLNATSRMVDPLPAPYVPGYITFDLGLSWQHANFEFSVYGHDLAESGHREFGSGTTGYDIPRSISGRAAWRI